MMNNKKILLKSLVSGMVYAAIMAAWDYYDGEAFNLWKFIFCFTFFGGVMGLSDLYQSRKKKK